MVVKTQSQLLKNLPTSGHFRRVPLVPSVFSRSEIPCLPHSNNKTQTKGESEGTRQAREGGLSAAAAARRIRATRQIRLRRHDECRQGGIGEGAPRETSMQGHSRYRAVTAAADVSNDPLGCTPTTIDGGGTRIDGFRVRKLPILGRPKSCSVAPRSHARSSRCINEQGAHATTKPSGSAGAPALFE